MLMDAMQTLAGRDVVMTAEGRFDTSPRRVTSCPIQAMPRISWMKKTRVLSSHLFRESAVLDAQGSSPANDPEGGAVIYAGVDIAKNGHVIGAIDDSGDSVCRPLRFKNCESGFEKCIAWLEGAAEDPEDVTVAMEATGHYWMACFSYLSAAGYAVVVINPVHVKAVRKLKGFSGVKNDRIDSLLIAETLRIGEYDPTQLATDEVQSLRALTRYRQGLTEQIAQTKTKVTCLMDSYFPEYAGLFSSMFGAASAALMAKSPIPAEIARMKVPALAKLLSSASRGRHGRKKAEEVRAAARASVGIRLGERTAAFEVREYLALIDYLDEKLERADHQIEVMLGAIEPLVLTIPGVSVTLGAQIGAEIGDIGRFRNGASVVKYAGLDSGVSQSGAFEAKGSPITKTGSPYLRRAIWLAAEGARKFDPKLSAFYEKKRSEGKGHRVAVTAVARKLCHIVYAVMRDQAPYDPDK